MALFTVACCCILAVAPLGTLQIVIIHRGSEDFSFGAVGFQGSLGFREGGRNPVVPISVSDAVTGRFVRRRGSLPWYRAGLVLSMRSK